MLVSAGVSVARGELVPVKVMDEDDVGWFGGFDFEDIEESTDNEFNSPVLDCQERASQPQLRPKPISRINLTPK